MGEAVDLLRQKVALAGSIEVAAYERTSSTGRRVHVSSYFRSPSKMGLGEIAVELNSLSGNSSQARNRRAALINEQRKRTNALTPKTVLAEIASMKKYLARLIAPEGHPLKNALNQLHTDLDHLAAEAVTAGASGAHHPKDFEGMLKRNALWSAIIMAYVAVVSGVSALMSSGATPPWQFFALSRRYFPHERAARQRGGQEDRDEQTR